LKTIITPAFSNNGEAILIYKTPFILPVELKKRVIPYPTEKISQLGEKKKEYKHLSSCH
jgi:hypothetical protein